MTAFFAPFVGLLLMVTTTGAATAAPTALDSDPLTMTTVGGDEAAAKTEAAMKALSEGSVALQAPLNSVKVAEAKVNSVTTEEGEFTTVTLPIGGPYSFTSNVSMVFDDAGNRLQFSETLVSENAEGNFNVTTYVDGMVTSDQDTDIAFMTDAELKADLENSQSAGGMKADGGASTQAEKNTGACIATVLGVSGVVGSIIAYSCAGACAAAAAGVGVPFCVACIAGFATVGGASITAVATCF